jgi:hypothetical protein
MRSLIAILLIQLFFLNAKADDLKLPSSLNFNDRRIALQILGLGSVSKVLANPYALGGDSGLEIGLESNLINTENLSRLGQKTSAQREYSFYNLTFGKGLYNNVDIFVHFAPLFQKNQVSNFGAQVRWMFFEAQTIPSSTSLGIHTQNTSFLDKIATQSLGFHLLQNITVDNVSLFFGIGQVKCTGEFIGGVGGVTESGITEKQDIYESHSFFGLNISLDTYFAAVELDRFTESSLSFKLGRRF